MLQRTSTPRTIFLRNRSVSTRTVPVTLVTLYHACATGKCKDVGYDIMIDIFSNLKAADFDHQSIVYSWTLLSISSFLLVNINFNFLFQSYYLCDKYTIVDPVVQVCGNLKKTQTHQVMRDLTLKYVVQLQPLPLASRKLIHICVISNIHISSPELCMSSVRRGERTKIQKLSFGSTWRVGNCRYIHY